ncbi:hypothetical protein [Chondrinema litorale]|uniref:hypothetical protein n=1 Tax=Chondrinema litorale TaxID=2994555 RepID=UPI002543A212|nr:hypothetical protein [Chondrinema litorale]UZR93046.1 hypothetical protein OQ292_14385 [Chondrinema litorale]
MGQTLFAAVAYLIFGMQSDIHSDENNILVYVSVFLSMSAIGASYILKPKLLETALTKSSLDEKLKAYTTACLVTWALLEGANMANVVIFIVTANKIPLVFFLAILLVYIPTRPDLRKISADLKLNRDEEKELGVS